MFLLQSGRLSLCRLCQRSITLSGGLRRTSSMVLFKSIPPVDRGESILELRENGADYATNTDRIRRTVKIAKLCSLGSTALGLVMMPILTSHLWEEAADIPSVMAFTVVANGVLALLTLTPLLLHFLTKRFIVDLYYEPRTRMFTSVHYSFFMRKLALRFRARDVVDAAKAAESQKFGLHLATCFVNSRPLLLSLDETQYRNKEAFRLLATNIEIPSGHD